MLLAGMAHTSKHKDKLLARTRRLKGQMEAIERALEAGTDCGEILNLVASVRGAISGLTSELIQEHIQEHVVGATNRAEMEKGAAELVDVIRTYLK